MKGIEAASLPESAQLQQRGCDAGRLAVLASRATLRAHVRRLHELGLVAFEARRPGT